MDFTYKDETSVLEREFMRTLENTKPVYMSLVKYFCDILSLCIYCILLMHR